MVQAIAQSNIEHICGCEACTSPLKDPGVSAVANIVKHPDVQDYFIEITLDQVRARKDGITDLYEANHLVLLKDYRLPIDLEIFNEMSGNIARVDDPKLRSKLKKLTSTKFFQGAAPEFVEDEHGGGAYGSFETEDPVRRAVYDVLCNGDAALFARASTAMKTAHEVVLELFSICFPNYDYFRVIPSVRLTTTLFENIHWDNHQIAEDFQQVRIFCNLDQRPRLWHTSHNFVTFAESLYREHGLEKFAGKDPNELNNFICGPILGGTANACKDALPRHAIAFEPGEVWFGESRMISHQIFYGERAMVYMFFVSPEKMLAPQRRFNQQVEDLHHRMAATAA